MGVVSRAYRQQTVHRYDDTGYLKYARAEDFPGLRDERLAFASGPNRLAGHLYAYEGCGDELIVFCHGIGGGHRSYLREIALLCGRGYPVFAYDNTGCFDSEGKDIGCMTQSLADLDSAVKYLKQSGRFRQYARVFVIGHSWGGFAAGNIASYQDGIAGVAVISGFISVERLLEDNLGSVKEFIRPFSLWRLKAFERKAAPDYCGACTQDAVNGRKTRFLFAHSTDDPMVPYVRHTGYLKEHADNPDVQYLIYDDRKHNPNYTADAAAYLTGTFAAFNAAMKAGEVKTLEDKQRFFADADWDRMTRQDEDFWDKVCAFLREA